MPVFIENSFRIWFATMPAVFLSGNVGIVSAATPETSISILTLFGLVAIVTMSFGSANARPKTSKPGPRFALVAGALTVTFVRGIVLVPESENSIQLQLLLILWFVGFSLPCWIGLRRL